MTDSKTTSRIPQIDKLLRHPILEQAAGRWRRETIAESARRVLAGYREELKQGRPVPEEEQIAAEIFDFLADLSAGSLRKVLNGTGVVLNTNLGRAPLALPFVEKLTQIACGYTNLEIDLETGKRGKRSQRLGRLLSMLTGCEGAVVVNNNAAAVLLTVNCFAKDKEVIVSRGELVEIGGSFRVPDVIAGSGAILKEVGTTNRTRIADYERAISEKTGLLMRCHRSNFEVRGFTEQPSLEELVALSARSGVPLVDDLGSGVLFDLSTLGLAQEPTVQSAIAKGCDMVTFSGDKLLGGPQAGIIVGRAVYLNRLAAHPLYRALRLDKVSIALLEQTLAAYIELDPEKLLPALAMIAAGADDLEVRVRAFAGGGAALRTLKLSACACVSVIGGGSLPGQEKPSWGIAISTPAASSTQLAQKLRKSDPPVIAVIQDDQVRIDFRTIDGNEEGLLMKVLEKIDEALLSDNSSKNLS